MADMYRRFIQLWTTSYLTTRLFQSAIYILQRNISTVFSYFILEKSCLNSQILLQDEWRQHHVIHNRRLRKCLRRLKQHHFQDTLRKSDILYLIINIKLIYSTSCVPEFLISSVFKIHIPHKKEKKQNKKSSISLSTFYT